MHHLFLRNSAFKVKISMCWQTHEDIFLMLKAATTFLHNNACSDGVTPVRKFIREERTHMMNPSPIPPPIKS